MRGRTEKGRELEWAQLDVFAEQKLEGNMLAVFPDATGLLSEEMQALARETNLSETCFILPRDESTERELGVKVRIFTTEEELPFAGHPTLGTASWLWLNHPIFQGADEIALDLKVGRIPVRFTPTEPGVYAEMRQRDPEFIRTVHVHEAVALALGLGQEDLDPDAPIETVSTGMSFCIVVLRSLQVLEKLRIPQDRAEEYLRSHASKFFYCIARDEDADRAAGRRDAKRAANWRARMQFYNGEDPATGSAAGCAISFLVKNHLVHPEERVVIRQGVEMQRPSRIIAQADRKESGRVTNVRIGGRTIPVATGRFFLL